MPPTTIFIIRVCYPANIENSDYGNDTQMGIMPGHVNFQPSHLKKLNKKAMTFTT